jgi:diguanylate cyclase (GGDEF)-like protein
MTENNKARILIIDDETHIRQILSEMLANQYECQTASSAEEGLESLKAARFSVVISDINMEGITGLEMVPQLLEVAPDTVVIMMSGAQTIENAVGALRVGAFDYLMKPFDFRLVDAAVRRAIDYHDLRVSKREYEINLEEMVRERTAELLQTTLRLETEIAERNRAEQRVNYLSHYDALTELPNRTLFRDRLTQALASAKREDNLVAVLLLSIDRLKSIGETLGSESADKLICEVAERLTKGMREGDTLAYWGDEFAFLFQTIERNEDAIQISKRLLALLESEFILTNNEVFITASIGIALYPLNGPDEVTILKNAAAALAQAQQKGGNNYQFYTADMNQKAVKRLSFESSLRRAIDREEFVLHYQPRIDINTWKLSGAEALIRWQHPERGLVSPAEFIPLAEETGLIAPIGEWVLRNSFMQMREWADRLQFLTVSSNISARQFQDPNFFVSVLSTLDSVGLAPEQVELELTESSIMTHLEIALKTLTALRNAGVRISIDDFGTGFSSLGYLKRLPIDVLKIDRSFVNDASTDPDDAALVMTIVTLAHNLRLKVVAEGVETEDQLRLLHLLRCDEIQGYLFSKPLAVDDFRRLFLDEERGSTPWDALRQKLGIKGESKRLRPAA